MVEGGEGDIFGFSRWPPSTTRTLASVRGSEEDQIGRGVHAEAVGDVRPLRVVRGDGGAERGPELFAVSAARRLVVCFSVSECEIRTVKCCGRSVSQANLYFFYKKNKKRPFLWLRRGGQEPVEARYRAQR